MGSFVWLVDEDGSRRIQDDDWIDVLFFIRCIFLLFQANDTLSFLLAIIFHNIVSISLCVMMTPRIGPTPLLHPWRAPATVFINKETFFVITSLFLCCYYPPLQPASSLTTIAQLFRTDFPLAYWGFSFFYFPFFRHHPHQTTVPRRSKNLYKDEIVINQHYFRRLSDPEYGKKGNFLLRHFR